MSGPAGEDAEGASGLSGWGLGSAALSARCGGGPEGQLAWPAEVVRVWSARVKPFR